MSKEITQQEIDEAVASLDKDPFIKAIKLIDADTEKRFTLSEAMSLWFKGANRIHYSFLHPDLYPPRKHECNLCQTLYGFRL